MLVVAFSNLGKQERPPAKSSVASAAFRVPNRPCVKDVATLTRAGGGRGGWGGEAVGVGPVLEQLTPKEKKIVEQPMALTLFQARF